MNMNKATLTGILFLIGGGCIIGFQTLSSMMTADEIVWKAMSLVDVTGSDTLAWVTGISIQPIQQALEYIVTMPLYLLFFGVGILMIIIGGFMSK